MINKKYELLESDIKGLYQIRALRDFGRVTAGSLGGYVSGEHNLSHEGDCWIYGHARVTDNAKVSDNAVVSRYAHVSDHAQVSGNAKVTDHAQVFGHASILEDAKVHGNAQVFNYTVLFSNIEILGNSLIFTDKHLLKRDMFVCGGIILKAKSYQEFEEKIAALEKEIQEKYSKKTGEKK